MDPKKSASREDLRALLGLRPEDLVLPEGSPEALAAEAGWPRRPVEGEQVRLAQAEAEWAILPEYARARARVRFWMDSPFPPPLDLRRAVDNAREFRRTTPGAFVRRHGEFDPTKDPLLVRLGMTETGLRADPASAAVLAYSRLLQEHEISEPVDVSDLDGWDEDSRLALLSLDAPEGSGIDVARLEGRWYRERVYCDTDWGQGPTIQSERGLMTLDLHGYRISRAMVVARQFLEQAWASGATEVKVVHGTPDKGGGIAGEVGQALHSKTLPRVRFGHQSAAVTTFSLLPNPRPFRRVRRLGPFPPLDFV